MKKNIFFATVTILFVLIFFVKTQVTSSSYSDIALANIEALANDESSGTTLKCYKTVSTNGSGKLTHITYCGNCGAVKANAWSNEWQCTE